MENRTIDQLLSSLAALVGDAKGPLFGQDKCMVDREQLLYLVETLQKQLPSQLEEANTIINSCNVLRTNAKKEAAQTRKEADQVLRDAEERAAKLIEETTIVTLAKKREKEILDHAQQQSNQLISSAMRYADHIMEQTQQVIQDTHESLNAGLSALQARGKEAMEDSMGRIQEARSALARASSQSN